MDRFAIFQLTVLLLALPAQYMFSKYFDSNEAQRSFALRKMMTTAVGFRDKYLSWGSWHKWCQDMLQGLKEYRPAAGEDEDLEGESPAIEVLKYRDPDGYYGGSTEPRSPRSPQVKYRVGQVIKHKLWGYRGVIIGWDETTRAPDYWLRLMHPHDKPHWRTQPNFSILVDTRDRLHPQVTYVPQENIEIVTNIKILHPNLEDYFEGFDGAQYLCRPWLRTVYPHD